PVAAFLGKLCLCICEHIFRLRSKADDEFWPLGFSLGDRAKNVGIFDKRKLWRRLVRLLLELLVAGICNAPVGDSSGKNSDINWQRVFNGSQHFPRCFNLDYCHAWRVGQIDWAADECDVGAGSGCSNSDGVSLLAG